LFQNGSFYDSILTVQVSSVRTRTLAPKKESKFQITEDSPIEFLRLSARAYRAMLNDDIETIGDILIEIRYSTLTSIKGVGETVAKEIEHKVKLMGFVC